MDVVSACPAILMVASLGLTRRAILIKGLPYTAMPISKGRAAPMPKLTLTQRQATIPTHARLPIEELVPAFMAAGRERKAGFLTPSF